jgi:glutamate dehydrogenase/leucine dehydrogenase
VVVHHLSTVDAEIVFDVDPEVVGGCSGGTRVADDVTVEELTLLARAMTYTFAAFEIRVGGGAAGIRPRLLDTHDETMARYRGEIRPLVEAGRFLTTPDLGSTAADFVSLTMTGDEHGTSRHRVGGRTGDRAQTALELQALGRGVVAAAEAWAGALEGRTFAIEGFGSAGAAVAAEVRRRGAKVVAVSTSAGAVADGAGLELADLLDARAAHGARFVHHLGLDVHRPRELHGLAVDVLVPGARPGVYTAEVAAGVQAEVISPVAMVPYADGGLDVLRRNRVAALPDFVANAGAELCRRAPGGLTPQEVLGRVDRLVSERVHEARMARMDSLRHATVLADTFLATWLPPEHLPDGPAQA